MSFKAAFLPLLVPVLAVSILSSQSVPLSRPVGIVVLENQPYSNVVGSANMPYLNGLIAQYSLATNFYANGHYSLPNYFVLTTGEQVTHDDGFTCAATVDNIVRQMVPLGKTWKAYAESLPYVGYTGPDSGVYEKHHNPFAYISDVKDTAQKNNIVPLTQLSTDLANNALPDYFFIIPNNQSNSHDCPPGSTNCTNAQKLQYMDTWLQNTLEPLIHSPAFQENGLLFITFDESLATDTAFGGGHIATVVVGPHVKRGYRSDVFYQHDHILRTTLMALGIPAVFGGARLAGPMADFFGDPAATGSVSGAVTDSATGQGVANATVSYAGGSTSCDAAGNFSLSNVPAGTVNITASASGYQATTQALTITSGANTIGNFALAKVVGGTIAGKVTNASTGAAVAGVTVSAGGMSTTTSTQGTYQLNSLPAGDYAVSATKTGLGTQSKTVNVAAGATVTADFALASSGKIQGVVTDGATGAVIAGATVNFNGGVIATNKTVTTSSSGSYASNWIPVGTYTVTVSKSGYATKTGSVTITAGQTLTLNFAL